MTLIFFNEKIKVYTNENNENGKEEIERAIENVECRGLTNFSLLYNTIQDRISNTKCKEIITVLISDGIFTCNESQTKKEKNWKN